MIVTGGAIGVGFCTRSGSGWYPLRRRPFSTGLPGRMNSSRTSCAYAQMSIARLTNSPPLSTVIAVGPAVCHDRRQRRRDPDASQRPIRDECERFAREHVEHRQRAKPPALSQSCADEVHRPPLIRPRRRRQRHPRSTRQLLSRFRPHGEPLVVVEAINPFRIDWRPFSFQEHRQPAIAEAHADRGQFLEPLAECVLAIARLRRGGDKPR